MASQVLATYCKPGFTQVELIAALRTPVVVGCSYMLLLLHPIDQLCISLEEFHTLDVITGVPSDHWKIGKKVLHQQPQAICDVWPVLAGCDKRFIRRHTRWSLIEVYKSYSRRNQDLVKKDSRTRSTKASRVRVLDRFSAERAQRGTSWRPLDTDSSQNQ